MHLSNRMYSAHRKHVYADNIVISVIVVYCLQNYYSISSLLCSNSILGVLGHYSISSLLCSNSILGVHGHYSISSLLYSNSIFGVPRYYGIPGLLSRYSIFGLLCHYNVNWVAVSLYSWFITNLLSLCSL